MNPKAQDIIMMLDSLSLPLSAARLTEILNSSEISEYSPTQLLREIVQPQYTETMNLRFTTNLRLSSLINRSALAENLRTGNGRIYNNNIVQQILSFKFVENRYNVGVYGRTAAGKSYFMAACCVEACRLNYRSKFVDYCDLMDELLILSRKDDLTRYSKRLKYYSRIQLLFLDDFAISRYSEDGIKILYHLIKTRTDLGTSTMFSCQYSPDEWGKQLSDEEDCYGKLDGIRRRLTSGYTVLIEKSV